METDTQFRVASGEYLKRHTEALIKHLGYAAACKASGKSRATLGRYASTADENADRYMPINVLLDLERAAGVPLVTKAIAELQDLVLEPVGGRDDRPGGWRVHVRGHDLLHAPGRRSGPGRGQRRGPVRCDAALYGRPIRAD